MKAKRTGDLLLILFSSLLIGTFGIFLFLLPHKSFSETENRVLAGLPAPNTSDLLDGSLSKAFALFCADQFPLRSHLVALSSRMEQVWGTNERNGILFGKNGFLIPRDETEDLTVLSQNLDAIQSLRTSATVFFVPRHVDVLTNQYPSGYSGEHAQRVSDMILQSDIPLMFPIEPWQERSDYYYKTDHHWTTHGAYAAYRILGTPLGYTPKDESFFEKNTASEHFFGTSHSKIGGITTPPDSVVLYRYNGDDRFLIQGDTTEQGFYRWDALAKKDHYEIFLGGNYSLLSVSDPSAKEKPRLLLIKDSYANALIPFLAIHFDLTVLDPRYRTESLPDPDDFDRILILYGASTVATDSSLGRLLRRLSS